MSSGESEYETAEEGDTDETEEEWERDFVAAEESILNESGFFLCVSQDGTRWFLPMYYRPENELSKL